MMTSRVVSSSFQLPTYCNKCISYVTEVSQVLTVLLGCVRISEEAYIKIVELAGENSILYDWEVHS